MNTLVVRLNKFLQEAGLKSVKTRRLVGEQEMMIAKGREQFQKLQSLGLALPMARFEI
jgi:hypothetical protein